MTSPLLKTFNKMERHQLLCKKEQVKHLLPDTRWFSKRNLREFLKKYDCVYIKPSQGAGGKGIFRVDKKKKESGWSYTFQYKTSKRVYHQFSTLYRAIRKKMAIFKKRSKKDRGRYLVQEGIPLQKFEDCFFDVRVVVQLDKDRENFEYRGMFVRVGHPKKIVTNISKRGRAMDFFEVFSSLSSKEKAEELSQTLAEMTVEIARILKEHSPKIVEVGFDFGFDTQLKPWLIEANLKPRFKGFRRTNEELYRKIVERSTLLRQRKTLENS